MGRHLRHTARYSGRARKLSGALGLCHRAGCSAACGSGDCAHTAISVAGSLERMNIGPAAVLLVLQACVGEFQTSVHGDSMAEIIVE